MSAYSFEELHAHFAEVARYGSEPPVNVFYLSHDPEEAARLHCDRHVVKMILETAQLLSTAWHVRQPRCVEREWAPCAPDPLAQRISEAPHPLAPVVHLLNGLRIYAPTHNAHPCAVWARETAGNYDWLWRLGMALCAEYTHRYGRHHGTAPVLWALEANPCRPGAQTEPPCAMPDELVIIGEDGLVDAVASYRNYYRIAKRPLLTYKNREVPEWTTA